MSKEKADLPATPLQQAVARQVKKEREEQGARDLDGTVVWMTKQEMADYLKPHISIRLANEIHEIKRSMFWNAYWGTITACLGLFASAWIWQHFFGETP